MPPVPPVSLAPARAPAPALSAENLRLAACVYATLESLRVAAVLLQPAMPDCAPRLLRALGLGAEHARLTAWASAAPGADASSATADGDRNRVAAPGPTAKPAVPLPAMVTVRPPDTLTAPTTLLPTFPGRPPSQMMRF